MKYSLVVSEWFLRSRFAQQPAPSLVQTQDFLLQLESKVHSKVRNQGEGPYEGLLLVESGYYRFHIYYTIKTLC